MFDRFIPKQISRTNYALFCHNSLEKEKISPNNNQDSTHIINELHKEYDTNHRRFETKKNLLEEIFCKYETKFGENFAYGTEKKKGILNYKIEKIKYQKRKEKEKSQKKKSLKCPFKNFDADRFLNPNLSKPMICSKALKVLDAPGLEDNFYYKFTDFSKDNKLLVVLMNEVHQFEYEINSTEQIYSVEDNLDISSVICHPDVNLIALGDSSGKIVMVDHETKQTIRKLINPQIESRIVATGFKDCIFGHGTREGEVLLYDIRISKKEFAHFYSHTQEVCSVKFSGLNDKIFATGGNDNKIVLYDLRKMGKLKTLSFHKAAVKALNFSKTKRCEMFTGGGSGDQMLCQWDVNEKEIKNSINLRSQICSLEVSSKNLVITAHGWPNNQIEVRNAQTLKILASFNSHSQRVLDLSLDKKEEIVVSSSGDQTIRFWSIKNLGEDEKKQYESKVLKKMCLR